MAAEVTYGQFLDVVEEFAFPEDETSVEELNYRRIEKKKSDAGLLSQLFEALERVNLSQLESSTSLASMSSRASLASSQPNSEVNLSEMNQVYQAMQQVLVPTQESSSALNNMEAMRRRVDSISDYLPAPVLGFIRSFDEFMHNPAFEDVSESQK